MKETMEIEFVKEICCVCNCMFMLPLDFKRNKQRTKDTFYCYNGHGQSYSKSTADLLQEKLDKLNNDKDYLQTQLNRANDQLRQQNKPKRKALRKPIVD